MWLARQPGCQPLICNLTSRRAHYRFTCSALLIISWARLRSTVISSGDRCSVLQDGMPKCSIRADAGLVLECYIVTQFTKGGILS